MAGVLKKTSAKFGICIKGEGYEAAISAPFVGRRQHRKGYEGEDSSIAVGLSVSVSRIAARRSRRINHGVVTLSSGEQTTAVLPEIRQWHPSLFSSAPWRGHDECEWREQSGCDAVRRRDFGWRRRSLCNVANLRLIGNPASGAPVFAVADENSLRCHINQMSVGSA